MLWRGNPKNLTIDNKTFVFHHVNTTSSSSSGSSSSRSDDSTMKKAPKAPTFLDLYHRVSKTEIPNFPNTHSCCHKASGERRAVKIVPREYTNTTSSSCSCSSSRATFLQYRQILQEMDHPNLVNLFESFEDDAFYYLVTERKDLPSLYEALDQRYGATDNLPSGEGPAKTVLQTLLRCLKYCHEEKGIVHCDICPENIILSPETQLDSLTIAGFGDAIFYDQPKDFNTYDYRRVGVGVGVDGTVATQDSDSDISESDTDNSNSSDQGSFAAPETRQGNYSPACDVWSVGIIAYQLVSGKHPFLTDGDFQALAVDDFRDERWKADHFANAPHWRFIAPETKDFVSRLLTYDPTRRPTASQALDHPWADAKIPTVLDPATYQANALKLRNYNAKEALLQATRTYIATNLLHKAQRETYDAIFAHLDTSRNGVISKQELKEALEEFTWDHQMEHWRQFIIAMDRSRAEGTTAVK